MVGFFHLGFHYTTLLQVQLNFRANFYLHLVSKILYVGYILVVGITTNKLKMSVRLYYCEKKFRFAMFSGNPNRNKPCCISLQSVVLEMELI